MSLDNAEPAFDEDNHHHTTHGDDLYDVYRLMDYADGLPAEEVSIHIFDDHKQHTCWEDADGNTIGPAHLLDAIGTNRPVNWSAVAAAHPHLQKHLEQTLAADYHNYPLFVFGESELLDGMHRLVHAWVDGAETLTIKRFQTMPEDAKVPRGS